MCFSQQWCVWFLWFVWFFAFVWYFWHRMERQLPNNRQGDFNKISWVWQQQTIEKEKLKPWRLFVLILVMYVMFVIFKIFLFVLFCFVCSLFLCALIFDVVLVMQFVHRIYVLKWMIKIYFYMLFMMHLMHPIQVIKKIVKVNFWWCLWW